MPLVILEGFAAGVPCVATDVGSCRDLIEGGLDDNDKKLGSAGAITRIANPEELAQEYIKFLDFDNGLWQKAQTCALKRVRTYYSQTAFLQHYGKLYEEAKDITWKRLKERVFPYYFPKKVPFAKEMLERFHIISFSTNPPQGKALWQV